MKSLLYILPAALCFAGCSGQKAVLPVADPSPYINTITEDDLRKHLYIIASDEMEGRNTGSEGQKKAGKYLIEQYKSNNIPHPKGATDFYQPIPSSYFTKPFSPKLNDSENIWAYIEGSDKKNEIVVVSAHYDHVGTKNGEVYNGADDDGSGTVALLEIAEAFAQAKMDGKGPRRSILFLHVTGEEYGLHGSRFYSENPLFPLKNTVADINIDMIGRRDPEHADTNKYVYVIGADRLSTDLHNITEAANTNYANLSLDYKYNDINDPQRFYYRSDHYNFAKNGIPSVFFFSGTHEDYHKPGDDPDKIEYDALAQRTKLAFAVAWELANRNERPKADKDGK